MANVVKTLREVATHFNRDRSTIREWSAKGMPGKAGAYDLDAIEEWKQTAVRVKSDVEPHQVTALRQEIMEADLRKKKAVAEIEEAKANRLSNRYLVDLRDVDRFLAELFTDHRRRIMRLADRIKGGWPAKYREDQATRLREYLELELRQMANQAQRMVDLADEE